MKITSTRISIVIPVYNAEKYLQTCIESVLNQTFTDFELIIIDDCSTDNSLEVVQKFNDPRIKIYRQIKNSGEGSARNLGLQVSTGKYVYFIDSDDALLPDCLEIFYKAAEETQADVVHMNSFLMIKGDFEVQTEIQAEKIFWDHEGAGFINSNIEHRLLKNFFNKEIYITPWIKFSRRDFLIDSQLYFPPTKLMADVLHLIGELCFAKKIYTIDEIGYIWRTHENQTTQKSGEIQLQKTVESIPIAFKFLNEIFASTKLIQPVSDDIQTKVKSEAIKRYLQFI